MMRRSVVLPEPDGPRSAGSVPPGTSSVTLSSARKPSKRFVTLLTRMLMRARRLLSVRREGVEHFVELWLRRRNRRRRPDRLQEPGPVVPLDRGGEHALAAPRWGHRSVACRPRLVRARDVEAGHAEPAHGAHGDGARVP